MSLRKTGLAGRDPASAAGGPGVRQLRDDYGPRRHELPQASSRADDQRVLLRASKLLHHVLACQRLPHRPERFLIHQPHRTPARGVFRATAAVVRPFARARVSRIAGVQRAVCATDDVDEVHAADCSGPSTALKSPIRNRTSPGSDPGGDLATDANPTEEQRLNTICQRSIMMERLSRPEGTHRIGLCGTVVRTVRERDAPRADGSNRYSRRVPIGSC